MYGLLEYRALLLAQKILEGNAARSLVVAVFDYDGAVEMDPAFEIVFQKMI